MCKFESVLLLKEAVSQNPLFFTFPSPSSGFRLHLHEIWWLFSFWFHRGKKRNALFPLKTLHFATNLQNSFFCFGLLSVVFCIILHNYTNWCYGAKHLSSCSPDPNGWRHIWTAIIFQLSRQSTEIWRIRTNYRVYTYYVKLWLLA